MSRRYSHSKYSDRVLSALQEVWSKDGESPTIRDLAELADIPSTSQVHHALRVLERESKVERTPRGRWKPIRTIHHESHSEHNRRSTDRHTESD